jgi:hypothetical protein
MNSYLDSLVTITLVASELLSTLLDDLDLVKNFRHLLGYNYCSLRNNIVKDGWMDGMGMGWMGKLSTYLSNGTKYPGQRIY